MPDYRSRACSDHQSTTAGYRGATSLYVNDAEHLGAAAAAAAAGGHLALGDARTSGPAGRPPGAVWWPRLKRPQFPRREIHSVEV